MTKLSFIPTCDICGKEVTRAGFTELRMPRTPDGPIESVVTYCMDCFVNRRAEVDAELDKWKEAK